MRWWVISGVLSGKWMVEWVLGGRWVEWLIDGLSTYWWFHFIIILSLSSSSLLSSSSESIYLLLSSSYNRSRSRQKLLSIRSPLPSPTSISFRSLVKSLLPTWIQWSSRRRWIYTHEWWIHILNVNWYETSFILAFRICIYEWWIHILTDNWCETSSWIGTWCIDLDYLHQWCRLTYFGLVSTCLDER